MCYKITYTSTSTLVRDTSVLVFSPVCPCACCDLSELFVDEERMWDWRKVVWVIQSQQGLIARMSFIEEPPNDLHFLWPFLCDVSAVRSEVLPGFLSSYSHLSTGLTDPRRLPTLVLSFKNLSFYQRRLLFFLITLKFLQ